MKTVSVPSRLWYENIERVLTFPDRWEVDNLISPGLEKPALSPDEIERKIGSPIEGPTLEEPASGRKEAAIVFDDMSRPTPVKDVAPFVLDALRRAGIGNDHTRGSSWRAT